MGAGDLWYKKGDDSLKRITDILDEDAPKNVLKAPVPLREMALVGYSVATPKWPGMKIEVETSEFHGTGEKPHAHLYPASHESGNKKDLITRFELTQEPPQKAEDIHPIEGNPDFPRGYREAVFSWSQDDNKFGVNNWTIALSFWEAIHDSRPSSQTSHR